jgi:tRNA 2-selenouridine synthase
MLREITIDNFFNLKLPLIDVRSPAEYDKGHIPGSVNIPLFSDEERAHVGTVYVQNSQEKATELAYRYIVPKLTDFIIQARRIAPSGQVTVHCWRGGLRSHSFARHLHDSGFTDVSIITGGYKAYRNFILHAFNNPVNMLVVGGFTGSGKTQLIRQLHKLGHQVIDLEALANHKGSAFGGIGQPEQPTTEQFENYLFEILQQLDLTKPVWLEDESRNIGGVNIPTGFFNQMQSCPLYFLEIPLEERARHLVDEYAEAKPELLANSLQKLTKRLGGMNTKIALEFLSQGKFNDVALLTLQYYDKSYRKGLSYRSQNNILTIEAKTTNAVTNAATIAKYANQ